MKPRSRGLIVILPEGFERVSLPSTESAFNLSALDAVSDIRRVEPLRHGQPERGVRTLRRMGVVVADEDRSETVAKFYSEVPGAKVFEDRQVRAYSMGGHGGRVPFAPLDAGGGAGGDYEDSATDTWARVALNLAACPRTGRGARVAVLDSGYVPDHPDFRGRPVATGIFNGEPSILDTCGHGTHCLGLVAGPANPARGPRYGVAPDASLYVGKVLGPNGQGWISDVLTGLNWAMAQSCDVVSLALGWQDNDPNQIAGFEAIASRVLSRGCLVVAAAGNESARPSLVSPVSFPANTPSALAVAALDTDLSVEYRSNRGGTGGAQVDIAAPGASMWSSWPTDGYQVEDGTSMATAFVAGVAALWKESNPSLSGRTLWDAITGAARTLPCGPEDAGSGLVQAPA